MQARDIALLRGLFESRVMSSAHVSSLYFDGRAEAAKKRIQKLKTAGLINERARKAFEPAIFYLTMAGLEPLRERGILSEYPSFDLPALERRARVSPITLRHELDVMDVKASVASAIQKSDVFTLAEFTTWPLLNEFHLDGQVVKPDGFIRIHENEADGGLSEHAFFLEVDRSTETQGALVGKAGCYLDYYKSGGFAERNGAARSAYREYPFRVLMIFKTAERLNNMAECLLKNIPPILTQVYLSTIGEAQTDPLGAIWIRPADYRDAVAGTPFADAERPQQWGYKRQTAREVFVEQNLKKRTLLSQ